MRVQKRLAEDAVGQDEATTETEWAAGVQESMSTKKNKIKKLQQPKPIQFYCV